MISLRYPLGLTLLLSLGACQSTVPIEIRESPPGSPPLSEAREKVGAFEGMRVRWGGTIVSVKNRENDTLIEILGKTLESDGEPVAADDSLGRFMVRVEGFLDPAIYRPSRDVTVTAASKSPWSARWASAHTPSLWSNPRPSTSGRTSRATIAAIRAPTSTLA